MRRIALAVITVIAAAMICPMAFATSAFAQTYGASSTFAVRLIMGWMSDGDILRIDEDLSGMSDCNFVVNKNITIDGNGHTLDFGDGIPFAEIQEGATLTIKNGNMRFASLVEKNYGTLIIEGGAYQGRGTSYDSIVYNNYSGTVSVSGANVTNVGYVVNRCYGNSDVTISDSTLHVVTSTVHSQYSGTVVFNNLNVVSDYAVLVNSLYKPDSEYPGPAPRLIVNGGTFKGDMGNSAAKTGTTAILNNANIEVEEYICVDDGTFVINGGTYISKGNSLFSLCNGTLIFNAGTFVASESVVHVPSAGWKGTVEANAGSFKSTGGAALFALNANTVVTKPEGMPEYGPYVAKVDAGEVKTALAKTVFAYTRKACKPAASATYNGMTYKAGADFTVVYSNNVRVGTAKATITFKDKSLGSFTKTFVINPAKAAVKSAAAGTKKLIVKMPRRASKYGASGFQVSYKVKGAAKWKTVKVTKQSKVISKLKTGKKYQVKVRAYKKIGAKTYYGAWSKVKTTKKIK